MTLSPENVNYYLNLASKRMDSGIFDQSEVPRLIKTIMENNILSRETFLEVLKKAKDKIQLYFNTLDAWEGDIDFSILPITSVGGLKTITGNVNFSNSEITNLNDLFSINGNADFRNSKIQDLGILLSIDGDVFFDNIKEIGVLSEVTGNIYYENKFVASLEELEKLLTNKGISITEKTEDVVDKANKKMNKLSVKQAMAVALGVAGISALSIGVAHTINTNKEVVGIESQYDDEYKNEEIASAEEVSTKNEFQTDETSNLPKEDKPTIVHKEETEEEIIAKLNTYLNNIDNNEINENNIEELLKFLIRNGRYFDLETEKNIREKLNAIKPVIDNYFSTIETWDGNLNLSLLPITSLGNIKEINGNVNCYYSNLESLGNLEIINGDLSIAFSKLTSLGALKVINGNANFSFSQIDSLEGLTNITKDVNFQLSHIPDIDGLQNIGGTIYLISADKEIELSSLEELTKYLKENNIKTR